MIPRFKPYLGKEEFFTLFKSNRNAVEAFEQKFAGKFGHKYGVMFSYGRTGIYSLLKVWGVNNKEVICPAYTCTVVPHAIEISGNKPIFIDSSCDDLNMNLDKIASCITQNTHAIVFTHILGYPANVIRMKQIVSDAEKKFGHKIYVIQDVAHSFGCTWDSNNVCAFGDAAIFGLNISKIVTSIFGGVVLTSNDDLNEKLSEYRNEYFEKATSKAKLMKIAYFIIMYFVFSPICFPIVNLCEKFNLIDRFVKYHDESKIEFPDDWCLKPMNWGAKIGLVQLDKYDTMIDARRKYAEFYLKHQTSSEINILHSGGATYSQVVAITKQKHLIMKECASRGVQVGEVLEYVCPLLLCYKRKYEFKDDEYPNAKFFSEHVINLPISGKWDKRVASKVIKVLNKVSS